jgi:hypothetical protein
MRLIKNYYFLIFPGLILFFLFFLQAIKTENLWLKMLIVVPIAYLLSPRIKVIQKLHSKEKQLRWFFSKKIIYIIFKE